MADTSLMNPGFAKFNPVISQIGLVELSDDLSRCISGGSDFEDYKLKNTQAILYDRLLYLQYLEKGSAYHLR